MFVKLPSFSGLKTLTKSYHQCFIRIKFLFSFENHRDLKKFYFLKKFANSFLLLQRTIGKKKIPSKTLFTKLFFGQKEKKIFFLSLSLFLALKNLKKTSPHGTGLKNPLKMVYFRVKAKIF